MRSYITGFDSGQDRARFTVESPGGLYDAVITYRAPSRKEYQLELGNQPYSGAFDGSGEGFAESAPIKVFLPAGKTTVAIGGGWGSYDIAEVRLNPTSSVAAPGTGPGIPVNPNASREARELLARLHTDYGRRVLSGVYSAADADHVVSVTGRRPSILAGDLMDYTAGRIARGAKTHQLTEQLIAAHRQGAIISLCWHWNAPSGLLDKVVQTPDGKEEDLRWYKGFYTRATTFDLAAALRDPNGEDYQALLSDIDAIAVELKKLQAAGVPVLWRPLHEAEGGWFWWGAKGPAPFKQLWTLLYNRLTHHHGLNNLLWVYSSGVNPEWYVGDEKVDIVGIDVYPPNVQDPLSEPYFRLVRQYGGRKLLALTEFGGVPDIENARRHGVHWAFFTSWVGDLGPRKHTAQELRRLYAQPSVK